MNEVLQDYVIRALEWLETGTAWLAGEIPIYITELLMWKFWSSIVMMGLGFLFLIGAFVFYKIARHFDKKWSENWNGAFNYTGEGYFFLFGTGGFMTIGLPIIITQLLNVIKISVAPRVFLLEYLSQLLN